MSFINPTILYGAALAAIPVILHLLLRSKPKKLIFPALRLVALRRRQSVRRLRLKHLWLLLLRVLVIAFIAIALARPSLPAANYGLTMMEWIRLLVIVALVAVVYWGVVRHWKKQRLPQHTTAYRRTFLRGSAGLTGLCLLALFVAWPYGRRIAGEISGPLPEVAERYPVAGVFLFDTSLSMEYRHENATRLEVAQRIALEHLNRLPNRSRIAVADSATDNPILFQADLASAQSRIEGLKPEPLAQQLNDRLLAALDLQEDDRKRTQQEGPAGGSASRAQDAYVREVYVFTDLTHTAWRPDESGAIREALDRHRWVNLYIIDVGVLDPMNAGLHNLRLSDQSLPRGGQLLLSSQITSIGAADEERTVEVYLRNPNGELVKQGQEVIQLDPEADIGVQFTLHGLTGPLHRGRVQLTSSDPFARDDVLYFTVRVQPPIEVLLVGRSREFTDYLSLALAPPDLVRMGKARYRCTYLPPDELARADLSTYRVVYLSSVQQLDKDAWESLSAFVRSGGALAVCLGTHQVATAVSYNAPEAQKLLPAELVAALKFTPPASWDLKNLSHPIFRRFEKLGGAVELAGREVYRYWKVAVQPDAHVVVPYSDSQATPAIVEVLRGTGRVVLITTALDLKGWSELPRAGWQYVAFVDQLSRYLAQGSEPPLNYVVGEEARVRVDPSLPTRQYLLRKPALQQLTRQLLPNASVLVVQDTDQVGHYEVVPAIPSTDFLTGFSTNGPPGESDLARWSQQDLDALFGENRYSLARDIEGLTRHVATGRLGEEIFPVVLGLVLLLFCAEYVVANWFYDEQTESNTQK